MKKLSLAFALILLALPGLAQIGGGHIYGKVLDESGAVLPGASVTLTSASGGQSSVSGSNGEFRFINVPHGSYDVAVTLSGFAAVTRTVNVSTGSSVSLTFGLKVATVEEQVTVTAETPIVDAKKVGTLTTLSRDELQKVPQARDPWAVLRTIPGVIVDRVNIAGNESGQQAFFQAKGSFDEDNMWNLEGVQIDDMAAAGGSPTYYDYDAFDEMAVTTGGNDLQVQTGAIGLNFVTKRGTNRWRGSARGFITHDDLQWSNIGGTELEGDPRLQGADKADHIQQISDYGFELGGPVLKDKLFLWGSYGKQDIRLVRTNQTADKTLLAGINAKLNWNVSDSTQATVFFFNGKKTKIGRDPGLGLQWEDSALWDQGSLYTDYMPLNIHGLLKLEVNHIFNPNFFVNVKYSNYDQGFTLGSRDITKTSHLDFANGVGLGGAWLDIKIERPLKHIASLDGNYFASGWGGQHELKFGFSYRQSPAQSITTYGGDDGLVVWSFGGAPPTVHVYRQALLAWQGEFFDTYLGDTFTKDRLTLSAGLRFDYQNSESQGATIEGNRNFPDLLPPLTYAGGGTGINWQNVSPRLGATYSLGEDGHTVVRASFARYASKLDTGATNDDNPLGGAYIAYYWDDLNADNLPQPNEVRLSDGIQYYGGFDPDNPTVAESADRIDPDYKAPTDYEAILGLEHQLAPNLAVSAAWTWRRAQDMKNWHPRLGMTSADYIPNAPATSNGYTAQTYSPDPAKVAEALGGRFTTNRPDYHRTFNGLELSLIKRLSDGWMGRLAFSFNDTREYYDGPAAIANPTRTDNHDTDTGDGIWSGPQVDGGQYAIRSSLSGKGDSFYAARWQVTANALYELPAGFEISGALFARQGFARPIVLNLPAGLDGFMRAMAVEELDSQRYPDLVNLDLRLAKSLAIGDTRNLTLSVEMFNVLNAATELNRFRQAQSNAFQRLDEILSPRVVRFGARLDF